MDRHDYAFLPRWNGPFEAQCLCCPLSAKGHDPDSAVSGLHAKHDAAARAAGPSEREAMAAAKEGR